MQIWHKHNLTANTFIYMLIVLLFDLAAYGRQEKVYWNQFRGPNGQGIVEEDGIPVQFGPESNVLWKTVTPAGHSSAVIWNNRIFLTGYNSTGEHELLTLCIDRKDGNILWRQVVKGEAVGRFHPFNNPASSTPAADEKNVYVYFGTYGLMSL